MRDLAVFDFVSGPELAIAGIVDIGSSGGVIRFDGTAFRPTAPTSILVGYGSNVLTVFDDGTGPTLYVVGSEPSLAGTGRLMRFENGDWVQVGMPETDASIGAVSIFDDGTGRALYCGRYDSEGGSYVAAYRGCPAEVGEGYCAAVANSTGQPAVLTAIGSTVVPEENLRLIVSGLPNKSFGVFLVGADRAFVPGYMGSTGTLCLGGAVGFFAGPGQVQQAGQQGALELEVGFNGVPLPQGATPIAFGDTWHFQLWYRDVLPSARPRTSRAVAA